MKILKYRIIFKCEISVPLYRYILFLFVAMCLLPQFPDFERGDVVKSNSKVGCVSVKELFVRSDLYCRFVCIKVN
jgi:hypothetical protein